MKRYLACAAVAALISVSGAAKASTLIDFEGGADNAAIGTDYDGPDGFTATNGYYHACAGGCPAAEYGMFASSSDFSSTMIFTFTQLHSWVSFVNVSFSSVTANAFDKDHNLLSSVSDSEDFPISGADLLLGGGDIKSVEFSGFYGIDNLKYDAGHGGVPEPATWAMMLVGFAGMGAMLRRARPALA